MVTVQQCVICDGKISGIRKSLVAPFLARRIWDKEPFDVELVRCSDCGFLFYNPRLEFPEEGRLYSGYRLDEYQRARQHSEPWYTPSFNSDLASPESYRRRREVLSEVLGKRIANRGIRRVLDYGGDRGDLVVGLVSGAESFVYEISGIPPVEGVTSVTNPHECEPDLVVSSNVLEHVGFPRQLMQAMLKVIRPGKMIYIEVPCEAPLSAKRIVRRLAQIGWMTINRPALAGSVLKPSALYMMHEHVNYFTEDVLRRLMTESGVRVEASGGYSVSGRAGLPDVIWCLGIAG